jgi:hypothetical protein
MAPHPPHLMGVHPRSRHRGQHVVREEGPGCAQGRQVQVARRRHPTARGRLLASQPGRGHAPPVPADGHREQRRRAGEGAQTHTCQGRGTEATASTRGLALATQHRGYTAEPQRRHAQACLRSGPAAAIQGPLRTASTNLRLPSSCKTVEKVARSTWVDSSVGGAPSTPAAAAAARKGGWLSVRRGELHRGMVHTLAALQRPGCSLRITQQQATGTHPTRPAALGR